jgi:trehalose/maltose hydrolase-like predicted phosphorylase
MTAADWILVVDGWDAADEGRREAILTLGNGRFATRGAAPESRADGVHYPGTYAAGCFNRLRDTIGDRIIESESMVNLPTWLDLRFAAEDGPWFALADDGLLEHRLTLDLRRGAACVSSTGWADAPQRASAASCIAAAPTSPAYRPW